MCIRDSSSTIQVHNGSANEFKLDSAYDYGDDSQTKMNTEVLVLESDTLLSKVATQMDLANDPDFFGAAGPMPHQSLDDPGVREKVVNSLKGSLLVALIPRTELIRITCTSLSPRLSADIVNNLVKAYMDRSVDTPESRTDAVSASLATGLDKLRAKVEQEQEQTMQLQRQTGALGYDSTHNQLQTSLEDLLLSLIHISPSSPPATT